VRRIAPIASTLAAVVAVALALVLSQTGSFFRAAPSAPYSLPSSPPEVRDVLPSIQAAWLWTGQESGGYADIASFRASPSLYQTAWNLRIAKHLAISTPQIDEVELQRWLQQVVRDPTSAHELSELSALNLAIQALRDLGVSADAAAVTSVLESLRVGTDYRRGPDTDPTPGSTVLAIQSMELAGIPVPAEVADAAIRNLTANCAVELSPQDLMNVLLPQLELAHTLLSPTQTDALRPSIQHQLTRLVAAATGSSGMDVVIAARVKAVENLLGISGVPDPTGIDFAAITADDGGLMLAAGNRGNSDPQTTYYGLLLGMKPGDRLIETIRRTALQVGWLATPSQATPQATFYATVVNHALGYSVRDDATRTLARTWLVPPPSGDVGAVRDLYFAAALARELRLDVPSSITDWVARALDNPTSVGLSSDALGWAARLAFILGLSVSAQVADSGASDSQHAMRGAFSTWAWSQVLKSGPLAARARSAAGPLAMADGTFRGSESVSTADLRSTVMGCLITSAQCASHVRPFVRAGLAWMFETDSGGSDGAELLTSYFWALGSGRTDNWAGVY
jgi:hypothetical protein